MSKHFLLLITLIIPLTICGQSVELIDKDGYKGLKIEGEEVLTPVYDDIGWSDGQVSLSSDVVGYNEQGKWGLISISGKRITSPAYDKLFPTGNGLFMVANKGKFTNRYFYGLIDEKGKIRLNQDYFEIIQQGDAFLLTVLENRKFLMGARSRTLVKVCDPIYEEVRLFGQVVIAKAPTGYVSLFDLNGEVLAKDLDGIREDGEYLITTKDGFDGLISKEGKVVHPPVHKEIISYDKVIAFPQWEVTELGDKVSVRADSVTYLSRRNWLKHLSGTVRFFPAGENEGQYGLIQAKQGFSVLKSIPSDEWVVYNPFRKQILSSNDSIGFDGAFFYKKQYDGWTVFNKEGEQLSDRRFELAIGKNRQFVAVKKFGFWALLDGINNTLSDFRYDEILEVIGTKAIVRYVNKLGLHQPGKGWLIRPDYDTIKWVNDHFLAINKNGHALYSSNGELRFRTIDRITPIEDYFRITYEDKSSAIGNRGRPISNIDYRVVRKLGNYFVLKNDFAEVRSGDGRLVFGNQKQIQDVLGFSEDLFLVKKDGAFGFVDSAGNIQIANRYDSARRFSDELAAVKLRGGWGFIDLDENLVIQPHYKEVSDFINGLAIYKSAGSVGFLSRDGIELSEPLYNDISSTTDGDYIIQSGKGLFGLVDKMGIVRLSPDYESLYKSGSYLIAKLRGRYALLDKEGNSITRFDYAGIQIQNGNPVFKMFD